MYDNRLRQQMFDRRANAAARRANENAAIAEAAGLSEEQIEVITEVCSLRHEVHTRMADIAISDSNTPAFNRLACTFFGMWEGDGRVAEVGLPALKGVNDWEFSSVEMEREVRDLTDAERDEVIAAACEWLEGFNTAVERWLADIDKQYGTHYCPTGAQRIW